MKNFKCITATKIAILVFSVCISIVFNVSISCAIPVEELAKTVVFLRYRFQVYETIEGKKVEVWYKRDPKIEKYEPKLDQKSGTGFIIKHNGKDYLVTARHVANFLGDEAEIIMNLTPDKSSSITFRDLKKCELIPGAKWFFHESNADIAIHPICYSQREVDHLSISDDMILKDDKAIPLLSTVYIVGFPLGLGVKDILSPIAKKVQIASRPISSGENNTKLKFILLDQALAQGYSGAPVFLIEDVMSGIIKFGSKPAIKAGEKVSVAGILSAQLSDQLGGKISVVVPSSYIWDIIQSPDFVSYESNLKKD
jgi:S1-C subfamily serine protease